MDGLAGIEAEGLSEHVHALRRARDQMHLDPAAADVVARFVREGVEVEVGAELAVDPDQKVAVEGRRHAVGIVIGRKQRREVLLAVDADDHRRVPAERRAHPAQERERLVRPEIADRRAGKEADPVRAQLGLRAAPPAA